MDQVIGKIIGGCFIEHLIGQGGMGAVYKAHHQALDIPVAVKILRPALPLSNEVKRFLREARTSARLNHPNIISVLNVGNEEGFHYITMEFIDGSNILEILQKRKKIAVAEAARIGIEVLRALETAFEHGIVHRDIKPENIMVSRNGNVKLADLGLALIDGETKLTQACIMLGSPFYIAPEQAENSTTVDHRADLYSLGCTLFHMVNGTPPFKGDSPVEIILSHLNKPIPNLSKFNRSVPVAFSGVIQKLMEKKPTRRFQHPREARLALESAVTSAVAHSNHYSKLTTHMNRKSVTKLFLLPTLILIIVGVLVSGFTLFSSKKQLGDFAEKNKNVQTSDKDSVQFYQEPQTVLDAVLMKDRDLLRKLLINGTTANPKPGDPISPLHAAVANADTIAIRMLLSMGANPNVRDSSGDTPLHDAIRSNNKAAVASLLHMGADPLMKDHYSNTPEMLSKDNAEIFQLLRSHGRNNKSR
ncbi:MAG: protein kinase [Chitinispirillaceae bacterium]|nr:protein kinase [Chitinispirillaceae bacterium]